MLVRAPTRFGASCLFALVACHSTGPGPDAGARWAPELQPSSLSFPNAFVGFAATQALTFTFDGEPLRAPVYSLPAMLPASVSLQITTTASGALDKTAATRRASRESTATASTRR